VISHSADELGFEILSRLLVQTAFRAV